MKDIEIQNKLKEVIVSSVQEQLKDVKRPFGLFLSGGIDSGLLGALTQPDVAFTCRFPYGKKYDEYDDSVLTAKSLNLKQETLTITKEEFKKYLPPAVIAFGRPTPHFSLVPLYMLFKKAKERGIETIIIGEGMDEYLCGYPSYSFILQEQKLYDQPELKNYTYALNEYLGTPAERFARILGKQVRDVEKLWGKYDTLLSNMGYTDLNLRGCEDAEEKLAEHFGIKLIYPYINPTLEKFCFEEVPDELKIKDFTTKYILRNIAEEYLPMEIVWRTNKMGGPVAPVGLWLDEEKEFSKEKYLNLQTKILQGNANINNFC